MARNTRGRKRTVDKRKLRVLLLETQLPARLAASTRRQIPFMQELLRPFKGLELISERVHSRTDLRKFLDLARRDTRIRVVHIVSHGEYSPKRPVIVLTGDEKINLGDSDGRRLFHDLRGKVILFSCCEVGDNDELMYSLLKTSNAKAIFAYTDTVTDAQALIIEALFYHLVRRDLGKRDLARTLERIHEQLKFTLHFLGIDGNRDALTTPLLTAYLP